MPVYLLTEREASIKKQALGWCWVFLPLYVTNNCVLHVYSTAGT